MNDILQWAKVYGAAFALMQEFRHSSLEGMNGAQNAVTSIVANSQKALEAAITGALQDAYAQGQASVR